MRNTRGRQIDFVALAGGQRGGGDSDEFHEGSGEDDESSSAHKDEEVQVRRGRGVQSRRKRRTKGLVVLEADVPFVTLLLDASMPEPKGSAKADKVQVPASFLEMVRAHLAPQRACLCEVAHGQFPSAVCVAAGRRIVKWLKKSNLADDAVPALPTTLAGSLAILCPVHQGDADAVGGLIAKVAGSYSVEAMAKVWHEFQRAHPRDVFPQGPGVGLSVFHAHMFWLLHVQLPHRFPVNNNAAAADRVLYLSLIPHLLRDLWVNFYWHITLRNFRLPAFGTGVAARAADNYPAWLHVMVSTVLHYTGNHTECGKTRSRDPTCAATVDITQSLPVQLAVVAAARKVAANFVIPHSVTDIHVVHHDQAALAAHFGVL
jgi:hypothetical protein